MSKGHSAPDAALRFDDSSARRAARQKFWRYITRYMAPWAAFLIAVTLLCNLFYRLSLGRLANWPAPLSLPSFRFQHADPAIAAFSDAEFCEPDGSPTKLQDVACQIEQRLALGDFPEGSEAAGETFPTDLVESQLGDALVRKDWATCSRFARYALTMLNQDDSSEDGTASDSFYNKLLLSVALCEKPMEAYRFAPQFSVLADAIERGAHLEEELRAALITDPPVPTLVGWHRYLNGLAHLRGSDFALAREAFSSSAAVASGLLRELALLGDARATYWDWRLSEGKSRHGAAAVERLRKINAQMKIQRLRSDVEYYIAGVRP